jgi:hypothetical protein
MRIYPPQLSFAHYALPHLDHEVEVGGPEEDTQGQEEYQGPGPENQREGEDDPPDEPEEATGEGQQGDGTAWNARATRAKAWVKELKLTLSGTRMWCYLQKKENLHLYTINVNGKPVGKELQQQILSLSQLRDCPIDGFILVDTRTAVKQIPFQTASWRKVFATTEIVIKILPATPMVGTDPEKARHWKMVGGSTILFLPRPGICIRGEPSYEPAKLGVYTCVTIGVGPTDSVLWIGAYIPHRNGREEGTGLRVKLRKWYRLNMTAPNVDGEEREVDKSFNVLDWLWNTPLANRIARAELNPLIKGVILTGDLNQRYESRAKGERALAVRTETIGLTSSLAERFQELRCDYPTYGWAHKGGGTHIDHVFTSLPPRSTSSGRNPVRPSVGKCIRPSPSVRELLYPGDWGNRETGEKTDVQGEA